MTESDQNKETLIGKDKDKETESNQSKPVMTEDEQISQYNHNCKVISELLYENSKLCLQIEEKDRLKKCRFPARVIQSVAQIKERYPLDQICENPLVADHIAYSMELQDLMVWMDRTFDFFGAIEYNFHSRLDYKIRL